MALDYSLPDVGDLSPAMKDMGDALTDVMKRRQEQQQFQQKLQFEREQEERKFKQAEMNNTYQNRIIDERRQREENADRQRQYDRAAAAAKEARHAATPQEAEAVVSGVRMMDPRTGAETGRGTLTPGPMRDVGPEPTAPVQPQAPAPQDAVPEIMQAIPGMPPELAPILKGRRPVQPAEGPMQTPEAGDARDAAFKQFQQQYSGYQHEEPAPSAIGKYEGDIGKYQDEMQALPGRQATYAADRRQAEAERPYTISFGKDGPTETFDFHTQRHAAGEQAAQDFASSLAGVPLSEHDRIAAQVVAAQLKANVIKLDQAGSAFNKYRLQSESELFKHQEGLLRDSAAQMRAETRAAGGDYKEATARGNLGARLEGMGNDEFIKFIDRQGYKVDVAAMKNLVDTRKNLNLGNSAADVQAGANFARSANGSGVLTNQDMTRFWDEIGGGEVQAQNWFERAITGKMGDDKRKIVLEGVAARVDQEESRLRSMALQADKKFGTEPWYVNTRKAYFDFIHNLPEMQPATGPAIGKSRTTNSPRPPEVRAHDEAKKKAAAQSLRDAMQ